MCVRGACALEHTHTHVRANARSLARCMRPWHSAGKVVDRHWYSKNKHIYPASRWAPFDAEKNFPQSNGDAQ